ncbi:MAG TPA: serine hydrolase domain-containing protein, partial [Flavitalea sp.]|nr:serine hydrolase domain-containing protein [Flavitalea sp.]
KLCDAKKLHLDTPLVRYLPQKILEQQYLKAPLMDERLNNITTRMVLSHTSGLPNWRNQKDSLRLLFAPGERYSYSGEGFAFLQAVVEYLTALPVNRWMEQTVFLPLKMNRSSFIYQSKDSADYVTSYENNGKPSFNLQDTEANVAHTFRTTAEDYARFLVAFISGSGLKNETLKLLFTNQVETDLCKPGTIFWGLGIALQPTTRGTAFLQWAKSPSASGYVFGFPEQRSAVVYFTNVANQGLRIGEAIVEMTEHYRDPLFSCFGVKQYNQ